MRSRIVISLLCLSLLVGAEFIGVKPVQTHVVSPRVTDYALFPGKNLSQHNSQSHTESQIITGAQTLTDCGVYGIQACSVSSL